MTLGRGCRDERGSGMIEFVWLALILLLPLVYVVLTVFAAQRGAFAGTAAARSAGRAYVLAPTDATGLEQARAAAARAFRDQGLPADDLGIEVTCSPTPRDCHRGGSVVTVVVRSKVALPWTPAMLGRHAPAIAVDSSFTAPIGQYQDASGEETAGG